MTRREGYVVSGQREGQRLAHHREYITLATTTLTPLRARLDDESPIPAITYEHLQWREFYADGRALGVWASAEMTGTEIMEHILKRAYDPSARLIRNDR